MDCDNSSKDETSCTKLLYLVKNSIPDTVVAFFSELHSAIDICSKRHYFVKHNVWRNLGNESRFDDYTIHSAQMNSFPMKCQSVQFSFFDESNYIDEIREQLQIKNQIVERARTADESLRSIEKILMEERGSHWKCTLQDKEIDMLILFEDAMYEESMYEPWGTLLQRSESRNRIRDYFTKNRTFLKY